VIPETALAEHQAPLGALSLASGSPIGLGTLRRDGTNTSNRHTLFMCAPGPLRVAARPVQRGAPAKLPRRSAPSGTTIDTGKRWRGSGRRPHLPGGRRPLTRADQSSAATSLNLERRSPPICAVVAPTRPSAQQWLRSLGTAFLSRAPGVHVLRSECMFRRLSLKTSIGAAARIAAS
jgi:hypothetical protein